MSVTPYGDRPEHLKNYGWGEPPLKWCLPVLWCLAPINGLFAVFLDWVFTSRKVPPG